MTTTYTNTNTTTTTTAMIDLIEHLRALGTGVIKPEKPYLGICYEIQYTYLQLRRSYKSGDDFRGSAVCFLGMRAEKWNEYSGSLAYPVPHPTLDPEIVFNPLAGSRQDMWADDEYGNARRRLCLFLADHLEKEFPETEE